MADNQKKIEKARIEWSKGWGEMATIWVVYEGETEETKFRDFFDDEIRPNAGRMVGMTDEEAREYIHKLDVAYLRS